jgi:hypothetical protein
MKHRTFRYVGALIYGLSIVYAAPVLSARTLMADQIFVDGIEGRDYCAPGRIGSTKVGWLAWDYGTTNVQANQAENIWGRSVASDAPIAMPWLQESAVLWDFPRDGYLAAKFTVPADLPPSQRGMFSHGETNSGPNIDTSISETCGDFYSSGPMCVSENVGPGVPTAAWKLGAEPGNRCPLQVGRSYYFNVRLSNPDAESFFCGVNACIVSLQNNHTP